MSDAAAPHERPTSDQDDVRRARVVAAGRVQGVFFRTTTREVAVELGLTGWVRNLPDGRVEAVFQGPAEQVAQAIDFCRAGPPQAHVDYVEVDDETPRADEGHFAVR